MRVGTDILYAEKSNRRTYYIFVFLSSNKTSQPNKNYWQVSCPIFRINSDQEVDSNHVYLSAQYVSHVPYVPKNLKL